MRKADNPFEPGAGTRPPELVGRELILEDAEAAIARGTKGRPVKGQIFYGLRGVGKTVLLRYVSDIARRHGALVADLETPEDKSLAHLLVPALRKLLLEMSKAEKVKDLASRTAGALQSFASIFKIKIGDIDIGVEKPAGVADSGDLEQDIPDLFVSLGELALAQKKLVILSLDEIQYLSTEDLSALITAIHATNQKSLPIGLFGAGLPQLLGKAGDAKSYAERLFQFTEIGALAEPDAKRAIREPITTEQAEIEDDALQTIVNRSQGYPYFLQEWGYRTWNEAEASPITSTDVAQAEARTIESLDKSFFRVRFDRLTPAEREYLRAMAELGPGPQASGEVAKVLGKKVTQTGTAKSRVIAKGMAFSDEYGKISFSVPMFDEFMRREMPDFRPQTQTTTKKATTKKSAHKSSSS